TVTLMIYPLSLHDALPISNASADIWGMGRQATDVAVNLCSVPGSRSRQQEIRRADQDSRQEQAEQPVRNSANHARTDQDSGNRRSEEHTSELQSRENLVCR